MAIIYPIFKAIEQLPTLLNHTTTILQVGPWDPIVEFLNSLLGPLFDLWENYSLRVTILSTIIWSFLIICGLVFILLESPSILPVFPGQEQKQPSRSTESQSERSYPDRRASPSQRAPRRAEKQESQNSATPSNETGVRVVSIIKKHYDKMILKVTITNGSDSKIDMVVVDLELPQGIETDIGSFRMQRIGSIESGESAATEFALKSLGGDPTTIRGQVEFLGASYEVSKVPISKPAVEE